MSESNQNLRDLELSVSTTLSLGEVNYTLLKGEHEFQPFEEVNLVRGGQKLGRGEITSFGHNRLSDFSEVNFFVRAIAGPNDSEVVSDKHLDDEFLQTEDASFKLSGSEDTAAAQGD